MSGEEMFLRSKGFHSWNEAAALKLHDQMKLLREFIQFINEPLKVTPHVCQYCGALTTQPDEFCYKAPHRIVGSL